jgi:hypothetical protein
LINVRLDTANAGLLGLTVRSPFFAVRNRVSEASNLTRYVPIVDAVTPVEAVVGEENVKVPGPLIFDHTMFTIPVGRPSSVTVPRKVIAEVLGTVRGNPGSTTGAALAVLGAGVGVGVGVAVLVGVGLGPSPAVIAVVAVPVRPKGSLTVSVIV